MKKKVKWDGLVASSIELMVDSKWLDKLQGDTNDLTVAMAIHRYHDGDDLYLEEIRIITITIGYDDPCNLFCSYSVYVFVCLLVTLFN